VWENFWSSVCASAEHLPPSISDGIGLFQAALDRKVIKVPGEFFDVDPGKRCSGSRRGSAATCGSHSPRRCRASSSRSSGCASWSPARADAGDDPAGLSWAIVSVVRCPR
jgi:hypothetical protein